jgi:hypothetical protein
MCAAHDFPEKVLELRNNPPLNPTAYKIYMSLTFPKNIYDPYFLKKALKLRYNPPVHPRLLPKKNFNFPQISKTHKHN